MKLKEFRELTKDLDEGLEIRVYSRDDSKGDIYEIEVREKEEYGLYPSLEKENIIVLRSDIWSD